MSISIRIPAFHGPSAEQVTIPGRLPLPVPATSAIFSFSLDQLTVDPGKGVSFYLDFIIDGKKPDCRIELLHELYTDELGGGLVLVGFRTLVENAMSAWNIGFAEIIIRATSKRDGSVAEEHTVVVFSNPLRPLRGINCVFDAGTGNYEVSPEWYPTIDRLTPELVYPTLAPLYPSHQLVPRWIFAQLLNCPWWLNRYMSVAESKPVALLPVKTGLVLSMDRTNWKFGESNINIPM